MLIRKVVLGVAVGVSLMATHAASAQSNYGNGGLFIHPTALLSGSRDIALNISYLNIPASRDNPESDWIPVNLTFPVSGRAEVGATYITSIVHGTSYGSSGVFGKFQLLPESNSRPAVALAGSYLDGNLKLYSFTLVASKSIQVAGRTLVNLHVGGQYVHWHDSQSNSGDQGVYIAATVPLIPRVSLVGELGSRLKFDEAATNSLGVKYTSRSGMSVGTGYVTNGRSRTGGFFFGIGRPIGAD